MKICSKIKCEKAGVLQLFENFSKSNKVKSGLKSQCKNCERLYRLEHKEEIAEKKKEWYQENKEEVAYKKHIHYLENVDTIRQRNEQYKLEHLEQILEYQKQYREEHKEELTEYFKQYNLDHKNEKNQKYHTDEVFRIIQVLRTRVHTAINHQYGEKAYKTKDLIGCEVSYLVDYLIEKHYHDFGILLLPEYIATETYHIDHIRPCASFDLKDPEQQKLCFNYKNMQILWWKDNLTKSDKYEGDL